MLRNSIIEPYTAFFLRVLCDSVVKQSSLMPFVKVEFYMFLDIK